MSQKVPWFEGPQMDWVGLGLNQKFIEVADRLLKCGVKTWLFWKFDNLMDTWIFCEIKFLQIQTVQKCHFSQFWRLWTLNFGTFWIWELLKLTRIKTQNP